ncbi:unnamed protein product, partial [Callosobruchus maculatus]
MYQSATGITCDLMRKSHRRCTEATVPGRQQWAVATARSTSTLGNIEINPT